MTNIAGEITSEEQVAGDHSLMFGYPTSVAARLMNYIIRVLGYAAAAVRAIEPNNPCFRTC